MFLKHIIPSFVSFFLLIQLCHGQDKGIGSRILFHGIVMDKSSFSPISNTQISINQAFSAVSSIDGTFSILVYKKDTVLFKQLGYKPISWFVSDTLKGNEFVADKRGTRSDQGKISGNE